MDAVPQISVVTGSEDNTAKLWDVTTGTFQLDLKGHTSVMTSAAFSTDGSRVVTGSKDNSAKLWDAKSGAELLTLKGHAGWVLSASFSPDGSRVVTGSGNGTAKVWDAKTGIPLLDLKGHTGGVRSVAFTPDGGRIVTASEDQLVKAWDAKTGTELLGEPIPQFPAHKQICPHGRFFAHMEGSRVELIPLQPDKEELAYRRFHTQPNLWRYREGYEAAQAARNDFAAKFYLKLLPPAEQKVLEAEAAAKRELAAGRTEDALPHLVKVSAAKPNNTSLALLVAALQAWFGREKELADSCGRALEVASGTPVPWKWHELAMLCCLRPTRPGRTPRWSSPARRWNSAKTGPCIN